MIRVTSLVLRVNVGGYFSVEKERYLTIGSYLYTTLIRYKAIIVIIIEVSSIIKNTYSKGW